MNRKAMWATTLLFGLMVCATMSAKKLTGVWYMKSGENQSTISYKILKKDGVYINLRSYDNGKTYQVTRKGKYEDLIPGGIYVEHLESEFGRPITSQIVDIVMTYTVKKDQLHLTFQLHNKKTYHEVWERADKYPVY